GTVLVQLSAGRVGSETLQLDHEFVLRVETIDTVPGLRQLDLDLDLGHRHIPSSQQTEECALQKRLAGRHIRVPGNGLFESQNTPAAGPTPGVEPHGQPFDCEQSSASERLNAVVEMIGIELGSQVGDGAHRACDAQTAKLDHVTESPTTDSVDNSDRPMEWAHRAIGHHFD